jgi:hypothetical protein
VFKVEYAQVDCHTDFVLAAMRPRRFDEKLSTLLYLGRATGLEERAAFEVRL